MNFLQTVLDLTRQTFTVESIISSTAPPEEDVSHYGPCLQKLLDRVFVSFLLPVCVLVSIDVSVDQLIYI